MDERISANEINKYIYCHYQWYYERVYGRKQLQELHKARNRALGLTDTTKSNFVKGLEFHNTYNYRRGGLWVPAILAAAVIFLLFILYLFLRSRGLGL